MEEQDIHFSSASTNLVVAFPGVVELYFDKCSSKSKKRDFDILDKRFALSGTNTYTLEDLGTYYDLTRERVRQIEAKAIKEIDLLLRGKLRTKGWSIALPLCTEYTSMLGSLSGSSLLVLEEQVDAVFLNRYGERLSAGYRSLFMEVAGYAKIPQSIHGFRGDIKSCWYKSEQFRAKDIESIFRSLDVIFDDPSKPLSLFNLTIKAKKAAKNKVSNEVLQMAISACSDLELIDDNVRVRFHSLRNAADKAFRILDASKKPMHFSAITREINLLQKDSQKFRPLTETNLKNQLVSDERYVAIGRSGEWGLSEWKDLNTGTIVDAISNVLHRNGTPMKFERIVAEVKNVRPDASSHSVSVYLNQNDEFSRVGRAEYALSAWRLPQADSLVRVRNVSADVIISAVKACFVERTLVPFPELIQSVRNNTKLSEASARQRLLALPFLDVRAVKGQKYKTACLVGAMEDTGTDQPAKSYLRELIQEEARSILKDRPNEPLKKGDLYKQVSKTIKCVRPTFYSYLSEMKDIRQYKEGNHYFAVLDYKEADPRIDVDLSAYNLDQTLKAELKRPLSKLTVEEVDIALFELGVIFENKLREFLQAERTKKVLNIYAKDMNRLVDMVNCAVREKVVMEGHHLNTLREERNKRAHGKVPTLQERQRLFNKAHYVADLFVKYIVLFHEKKNST